MFKKCLETGSYKTPTGIRTHDLPKLSHLQLTLKSIALPCQITSFWYRNNVVGKELYKIIIIFILLFIFMVSTSQYGGVPCNLKLTYTCQRRKMSSNWPSRQLQVCTHKSKKKSEFISHISISPCSVFYKLYMYITEKKYSNFLTEISQTMQLSCNFIPGCFSWVFFFSF